MAVYISHQPKDFFNSILYTGTGSSQALTGVGFQPDFVWCKMRDAADAHALYTSPTGTSTMMQSNSNAVTTTSVGLTSFDSDGFTVDTRTEMNSNTKLFIGWNWKAATTTGLSGGTITPSAYSINTTSKFGIYKYTGNGTSGATISHGLGAVPKAIWVKKLSANASWQVGHAYITEGDGNDWGGAWELDTATVYSNSPSYWNDTDPTDSLITLGNDARCNTDTATYIMYAWCHVLGSHSQN